MQQLYSFFKGDCNNTKSFSVTLFWYQYCWIWTNSVLAVYMLSYNLLKFFSEWIVEEKYKMLVASANWFFFEIFKTTKESKENMVWRSAFSIASLPAVCSSVLFFPKHVAVFMCQGNNWIFNISGNNIRNVW